MRSIAFAVLFSTGLGLSAIAAPVPSNSEPSAKELEAAKTAYAKYGAKYHEHKNKMLQGVVHQFRFGFEDLPDKTLNGIPDLPFAFMLYFEITPLPETAMVELGKLSNLKYLFLGEISPGSLKHLKGLKNLTGIYFSNTNLSDSDFSALKDMKGLTELELSDTTANDGALKELKTLEHLSILALGRTKVTDQGMKDLKEIKNLRTLDLRETQITNAALKDLKELKKLTTLDLSQTQVSDDGIKELKEHRSLELLVIGPNITDAGLKELKELKTLKALGLVGAKATDTGIKDLQSSLPNCKVFKEKLPEIPKVSVKPEDPKKPTCP